MRLELHRQSTTLFIIVIRIVIDHIEESELIDPLARRHNTKPIPQLLLLEKLLRPAKHTISIRL